MVLKVIKGSKKGQVYALKNNMVLGRNKGDIVLNDHLVSDPHARIEIYDNNTIMLTDEDSKNGIFVNGQQKVKTRLVEGSQFTVGNSTFEVVWIQLPEDVWSEILTKSLEHIEDDSSVSLSAFHREVHLVFVKGYLKGQTWVVTYGPRSFGSESPEHPIFGHQVPAQAFALLPKDEEVLFVTSHPQVVCLNGQEATEQTLKNGDVISIGSLEIKVKIP